MSTSSSGAHSGKAAPNADEGNKGSSGHCDVEQGDLETEKQRYSPNSQESGSFNDGNFEDEPDEYIRLLKFIDVEAKKEKRRRGRDRGGDEEQETRRLWYMPWKKVVVESTSTCKVPQRWLDTDMSQGLSESEINERRARFGYNELESPRVNPIVQLVGYFRGPILFVMELAVLLSAGLRGWIDFGVIIGILMLNAFVGWYQEKQAGDIVEQLKAGIAMKAIVVRGGKEQEIEARELVPGDIVVIEEGQTIPADGKILAEYSDKDRQKAQSIVEKRKKNQVGKADTSRSEGSSGDTAGRDGEAPGDKNDEKEGSDDQGDEDKRGVHMGPSILSVDQSAITGESLAVDKYIGDTVYYTTGTRRGKCYIIVTDIAKESFVGRTASLVNTGTGPGHFQRVMSSIGTTLLVLVIIWLLAVWIGGFFRGVGLATPKGNNLLVYTLIFLIIGVPVGLPCVTTTTMADRKSVV